MFYALRDCLTVFFFFFLDLRGCLAKFWDEGIVSCFDPI